jgi:hypothetical protein
MSQIVLDAIDAELRTLVRIVPARAADAPLGFGRDLSCVVDVTADMAEVDPASPVGIGQAAIRRLITPRGTLADDPGYGIDVRGYCNRGVTAQELRELGGLVRLELTKDDRIADVSVAVTTPSAGALHIDARITPADPDLTPFALIFSLQSGALTVEAIG